MFLFIFILNKLLMRLFTQFCLAFLLSISIISVNAQNKTGILILAHGGSDTWNELVNEAIAPLKEEYSVAVAFGMANPKTLEAGIRSLETAGVKKAVVVPLFISSHSFIIRQTEYFLGKRTVLADPLILMDHSSGGGYSMNHSGNHSMDHSTGEDHSMEHKENKKQHIPPQIETHLEIEITRALDDHDVVAQMLKNRADALSSDPSSETLILVGHGPNPEEDNKNWIKNMESLVDKIRDLNAKDEIQFKNYYAITVRDDASPEIYEMAKENLRGMVRQAGRNSRVIVVPLLLSSGGVERGIVKRLEGLDYEWNGKTLLPDPLITEFIRESVQTAQSKSKSQASK